MQDSATVGDQSGPEAVLEAFELVAATTRLLAPRPALSVAKAMIAVGEAIQAQSIAAMMDSADDTRGASAAAGQADRAASRRKRRQAARRGAAVKKNKTLGERFAGGELSGEQVDLLATADDKSDGAALADDELVDRVAGAGADQTKSILDQWLAEQRKKADVEAEYQRQRKLRNVTKYTSSRDGLTYVAAGGDDATMADLYRQILAVADQLYQTDGGRDLPHGQHPRTGAQRSFDAFEALITGANPATTASGTPAADHAATGTSAGTSGTSAGAGGTGADGVDNPSAGTGGTSAGAGGMGADGVASSVGRAPQAAVASKRYTPPARAQAVIVFDADKIFGTPAQQVAAPMAEMIGHGPIADELAAHYLQHADLVGALFKGDQPLRLGRKVRHATRAQILALTIRDRGCGLCGADYSACHAHHVIPYNAPAQGQTNTDDLVLVCPQCHHRIHRDRLTITWDTTRQLWTTRPATPDEIPPPPPPRE